MSGLAEVLVGVLAGRRIAAANVPADQTFTKLHPELPSLETFCTTVMTGPDTRIGHLHMLTTCHSTSWE
jgi:hypothetical protein